MKKIALGLAGTALLAISAGSDDCASLGRAAHHHSRHRHQSDL